MKAILFDHWFEAPDEFKEFYESLGYKTAHSFDLMFDSRIIEFCEQRLSWLWNEKVYKGKESYKFRIGFAGAGHIRDIDTTRKWIIEHNNVDAPIIKYVDVHVNKYGHVSICYNNKNTEVN